MQGQQPASNPALEPWREAVRSAADAIGLIEVPSTRFVELSSRAWEMVGRDTRFGLDALAPDARDEAASITRAAAAGIVDGTEARRRQFRRPDGSTVDVIVRARTIRLHTGTFGVWVARDLSVPSKDPVAGRSGDVIDLRGGASSHGRTTTVTLDERWRVSTVTSDAGDLHDMVVEGVHLVGLVRPDDMARLVFAFAGATTAGGAEVRTCLRSTGGWVATDIQVRHLDDGSWHLELARLPGRDTDGHADDSRVAELEGRLRRIAIELRDAGVLPASAETEVWLSKGVMDLPGRQREVVIRLARGERVATIAERMFLSTTTVRNHLSAVFRKFGVHSQRELLILLRGDDDETSSVS